jgi:hypothetical protein
MSTKKAAKQKGNSNAQGRNVNEVKSDPSWRCFGIRMAEACIAPLGLRMCQWARALQTTRTWHCLRACPRSRQVARRAAAITRRVNGARSSVVSRDKEADTARGNSDGQVM